MVEHPILFSTEMVRAILRGEKTVTRRIIKPQPKFDDVPNLLKIESFILDGYCVVNQHSEFYSPLLDRNILLVSQFRKKNKYSVGDQLWVRESFCYAGELADGADCSEDDKKNIFGYKADLSAMFFDYDEELVKLETEGWNWEHECVKWKPSIHMPRRASRIQLEIVNIKVERLQDITEKDAKAEGMQIPVTEIEGKIKPIVQVSGKYLPMSYGDPYKYKSHFAALWDELNFKRGYGWEKNPFVWIIEFKRI